MDKNPWEPETEHVHSPTAPASNPRKSSSSFDIHYRRVLSVWPWMLPAGLLFWAAAWLYLRYQDDVYRVSASIVIQDPSLQVANVYSTKDPINDNIARLRSPTLMKRVVDSMGLQYKAYVQGSIKSRDLYEEVQWRVLNRSGESAGLSFEVEKTEGGFTWRQGNQTGTGTWGQPFRLGNDEVLLQKKQENISARFTCAEADAWSTAFALVSALYVGSSKINNVVELSLEDFQRRRAVDIINTLIQTYNFSVLSEKRKSQEQAITFISERLEPLAFQLDSIEQVLARFKADKGILLGAGYLSRILGFDDQLTQYRLKDNLLRSGERFMNAPETRNNQLALPGVEDNTTQQLIGNLLQLWSEREKLALTVTENNPKLQLLDKQIAEVRENLNLQLQNYRKVNQLTEQFTQQQRDAERQQFSLTPFEEKRLNEIIRFQDIKLKQFLELLQRKEEAGIALASVAVETFIIRPALIPGSPIGPARMQIMLTAFFIGIWLPFGVALIAELLNNKVISKNQLQQLLTPPVLAELDLVENNTELLHVKRRDRSIFGEQMRSLRTALRYYAKPDQPFYILVTSSMSGEGKSFISANLAASFALQGKRVALLEFDLRRPKLSKRFGIASRKGISTALIDKAEFAEIKTSIMEEGVLDLYPSGPVPPNPSELLSSQAIDDFKYYLDTHYDVIIIDTPPNGIVADAQLLQHWAQVNLVLTRFRQTVREQVKEVEEWYQSGLFRPMAILLNGVSVKGYYGNRYSYYYTRRKYGYKYYSQELGKEEE